MGPTAINAGLLWLVVNKILIVPTTVSGCAYIGSFCTARRTYDKRRESPPRCGNWMAVCHLRVHELHLR